MPYGHNFHPTPQKHPDKVTRIVIRHANGNEVARDFTENHPLKDPFLQIRM